MEGWWAYERFVLGRTWKQDWLRRDAFKFWVGVVIVVSVGVATGITMDSVWRGVLAGGCLLLIVAAVAVSKEAAKVFHEQRKSISNLTSRASSREVILGALRAARESTKLLQAQSGDEAERMNTLRMTQRDIMRLVERATIAKLIEPVTAFFPPHEDYLWAWSRMVERLEADHPGEITPIKEISTHYVPDDDPDIDPSKVILPKRVWNWCNHAIQATVLIERRLLNHESSTQRTAPSVKSE